MYLNIEHNKIANLDVSWKHLLFYKYVYRKYWKNRRDNCNVKFNFRLE